MGPLAVAVLGLRYRKDMPALQIHVLNNQRCHDMPTFAISPGTS